MEGEGREVGQMRQRMENWVGQGLEGGKGGEERKKKGDLR